MLEVLTRLHYLTGDAGYRERAEALVQLFSGDNPQYLLSIPGLLTGAELLHRAVQVVIVGDPADVGHRALRQAVRQAPQPLAVVALLRPEQSLPPAHPAAGKTMLDGRPTAYVCVGPTCSLPIVAVEDLRRHLASA